MTYSYELVNSFKKIKGLGTDAEAAKTIPKMTKGSLFDIKNGKRHLTEEQALWIANECQLDAAWVLVNLSEEKASNSEVKAIWGHIAKMIAKSVNALVIVGLLLVSQGSVHKPNQRIKYSS